MHDLKWDVRFLELAEHVSRWSKDPSTKVGAVLVRPDRTLLSVGYNGFPRGTNDAPELYANRELKYAKVVHAELNAILNARDDVRGSTLYTWPPGYGASCERCTVHVIQAGIARVVYVQTTDPFAERWKASCLLGLDWYREAGVDVTMITMEQFNGRRLDQQHGDESAAQGAAASDPRGKPDGTGNAGHQLHDRMD